MKRTTSIQQVIAIMMFGYIVVLFLRFTEGIMKSIFKILGMLINVNPKIFEFLELIPEILLLVFWIILIIYLLKDFSWSEIVDLNRLKRFGKLIGLLTISFFIVLNALRFIEAHFWSKYLEQYNPNIELIKTKMTILQVLNFIETIIVVTGFIKILSRK